MPASWRGAGHRAQRYSAPLRMSLSRLGLLVGGRTQVRSGGTQLRLSQQGGKAVVAGQLRRVARLHLHQFRRQRSEEHTSELQSLMRISYAVFCLTKKNDK